MANRPTHSAYVVIDPPEGSDRDAKARWIEIAPLWPHKDGQGYDLLVPQGISVGGRIVIRERRTDQD